MKKKLLAMTLALALCLGLLPVSALAAVPKAGLTVTSLDGNVAGAQVTLNVTLAENPGLSQLQLELEYDETRLEPVLNEEGTCFTALGTDREVETFTDWEFTENTAVFEGSQDVFFNGDILTLTFKIRDDAPLGAASVSLKAEGRQLDDTQVELRINAGGVRVLKEGSHVHNWGEPRITKEPTCTGMGVRRYKCEECKATRSEDLPALGHNWGPWEQTKAPTATAPGQESRSCTNPGCTETETREISGQTVVLTLDAAGGEVVPDKRNVIKDSPVGLLPTPTREGYTFLGWYSDPDTGSLVEGSSSFSNDATLWAHWEEAPEEDQVPTLEIGSAVAASGQKITLAVRLKGNPGIAGLSFALDYNKDALTYESFEDSGLKGWMVGTQAVWMEAADTEENGEILLLTFRVNEEVEEGELELNFRDVVAVNQALEPVELLVLNGNVEIRDLLPGDVDGSGKVDLADLVTLIQFIGNDSVKIQKTHADLNGDGKIDVADALALQTQLANAD